MGATHTRITWIARGLVVATLWLVVAETSQSQQVAQAAESKPVLSATPAQTAGTILTVTSSGISTATLALNRSTTPEIREFAQGLLDQHFAVARATLELSRELQIQPEVSDVSARLAEDTERMLDELATSGGPEFERAFVRGQIESLQAALVAHGAMEGPSRGSTELESLLAGVRSRLQAELERAREINGSIG